ncbi:MAG: thiamine phosphate synthase [Planctomycetota bacterium]|nr:thiamine phosphate synthase [Planctomycetota bacterium]
MTDERPSLPDALRLVYIVDADAAGDWRRLDGAVTGGITAVWLRAPGSTGADLYGMAKELVRRCHPHGVAVIVGDRADVALAAGADAVQLGFRSPPARRVRPWFPGWIGVSCHSADELGSATRAGADYAVLSPVFGVPDKGAPLGPALFEKLCADAALPVVALGGIEVETIDELEGSGAAGVAVIRALRDAADPAETARRLRRSEMTRR